MKPPQHVALASLLVFGRMLSKGLISFSQLSYDLQQMQLGPLLAQIVSMDDESTMPEGWGSHTPPPASPWTDASIYELHIRDFRYCHTALLMRHHRNLYVLSCLPAVCLPACLLASVHMPLSLCFYTFDIRMSLTFYTCLAIAARAHASAAIAHQVTCTYICSCAVHCACGSVIVHVTITSEVRELL